jgi:hypothetical protein
MRFVVTAILSLLLAACATGRLEPVPESGAYSVHYVELDGDYYLRVDRAGADRAVIVDRSRFASRQGWSGADWSRFAGTLFPQDDISFEALRELRGSALVPMGLVSPTPATVPPCETTRNDEYAKVQVRTIRRAPRRQPLAEVTMVTECWLHEGLSPRQYGGIHQRPNPYRLPTRYETYVDLDRNGRAEQVNVRIRNVPKSEAVEFVRGDTRLDGEVKRSVQRALDRL